MPKRHLAAILSLDVVSFSAMMERDPDRLVAALNDIFKQVVQPRVASHTGRVIKLMGDGALIEFASAHDAVCCAVGIQQDMAERPSVASFDQPIRLRAGLQAGEVIEADGDVFGSGINVATRLQADAPPGGILLTRALADLAGGDLPFALKSEGVHSFKNIAQPLEVLAVDMGADPAAQAGKTGNREIRFCKTGDGASLAWTTSGSGPKLVKAANWISHLELDWRSPALSHILTALGRDFEIVRFDARGNGLSDWSVGRLDFDALVDDLESIFDAAEVERAPILALSQGCAVAAAFAARCPERVSAIIMMGGFALGRGRRDSPKDRERAEAIRAMMKAGWDDDYPSLRDMMADLIAPQASAQDKRGFAEDMLQMVSPQNMARYRAVLDDIDITDILPQVTAPCLVMHGRDERMHPVDQGRLLAAGLKDSRFVALDSNNHVITGNDPCWPRIEADIRAFLAGNA